MCDLFPIDDGRAVSAKETVVPSGLYAIAHVIRAVPVLSSPVAFVLVGLIPVLLWTRHARAIGWYVYALGWLSWFCAVSVKFVLGAFLGNWLPLLFLNAATGMVTATLLETTEVVSAHLFLRCHPALKPVRE